MAGNRAATSLVVQRHDVRSEAGDLDELEDVVQRVVSPNGFPEEEKKVTSAVKEAAGASKSRNPVLYNTGKAILKGGVNVKVRAKIGKAQFERGAVWLDNEWVTQKPSREIQGALAHEVAHALVAGGDLDEYRDEFNAYWAEIKAMASSVSPELMAEKLPIVRNLVQKYGWYPSKSDELKQLWSQLTAPAGFNLSNSWKQARLRALMAVPTPANEVVAFSKKMDVTDRTEARDSKRPDGTFYLQWATYSATDRAAIWKALGGQEQSPS